MNSLERAIASVEVALHSAVAETRVALENVLGALKEERARSWAMITHGGKRAARLMDDRLWAALLEYREKVRSE